MQKDFLTDSVKLLMEILEKDKEHWKLLVVSAMLDELCRMERILYPEYYWSKEYLDKSLEGFTDYGPGMEDCGK